MLLEDALDALGQFGSSLDDLLEQTSIFFQDEVFLQFSFEHGKLTLELCGTQISCRNQFMQLLQL